MRRTPGYSAWQGEVPSGQGGLAIGIGCARVREWTLCPDRPQEWDSQGKASLSNGPCVEGDQEAASGLFGETRLPSVD